MKLKNKKTGEITEFVLFDGKNELQGGATLKDLLEEWEDVPEEPKKYWFIGDNGAVFKFNSFLENTELEKEYKEIGNYFKTKEEAEQAVEKLKAWKRLRDKGFKFIDWKCSGHIEFTFNNYCDKGVRTKSAVDDLDLLFGGEE